MLGDPRACGHSRGGEGQYETFIASGRAFAIGLAYTEHDSRIVRRDLARIAAEISG